MNIALWVLQGLIAVIFLMAGSVKAFLPLDALAQRQPWVEKANPRFVRLIGICELAAAVGLMLPLAGAILPQLAIAAALGLAVVMASATVFNLSRRVFPASAVTLILFFLVVAVVVGRMVLAPL